MTSKTEGGNLEVKRTLDKNGNDTGFQSTFSFKYHGGRVATHFTPTVDGKPFPEKGLMLVDPYGKEPPIHVQDGAIVDDKEIGKPAS